MTAPNLYKTALVTLSSVRPRRTAFCYNGFMPQYRRAEIAGGTFFFAIVTFKLKPNNPVKHGLVKNVSDWLWSSFHRFMVKGYYEVNWGEMIGNTFEGMEVGE
jgi:hypothetical protein